MGYTVNISLSDRKITILPYWWNKIGPLLKKRWQWCKISRKNYCGLKIGLTYCTFFQIIQNVFLKILFVTIYNLWTQILRPLKVGDFCFFLLYLTIRRALCIYQKCTCINCSKSPRSNLQYIWCYTMISIFQSL